MNTIRTLKEAKKYRYDVNIHLNPKGTTYREGYCVEAVVDWTRWHYLQCSRKNGYGPKKLYCKQHAKKIANDA